MNRNKTRKPSAKQQRGLHSLESSTAYGFTPVVTKSAPVQTKKGVRA